MSDAGLLRPNQVPNPIARSLIRRSVRSVLQSTGLLGFTREIASLFRLSSHGLRDSGWRRSANHNAPVSSSGAPIPWFPYPAIEFLRERLPASAVLFEWGAGHSTLWFSERVSEVTSVESDPRWAEYVRNRAGNNVNILVAEEEQAYVGAVTRADGPFDIVVVDGPWSSRYRCGQEALGALAAGGVVLWDNADRPDFARAWEAYLSPRGFRRLPFRGLGPLGHSEWTLAILYRDENCLGI